MFELEKLVGCQINPDVEDFDSLLPYRNNGYNIQIQFKR